MGENEGRSVNFREGVEGTQTHTLKGRNCMERLEVEGEKSLSLREITGNGAEWCKCGPEGSFEGVCWVVELLKKVPN